MVEQTSTSGRALMSSENQIAIIKAHVDAEPYAIFENFGFSGLDTMLVTVKEYPGFFNII